MEQSSKKARESLTKREKLNKGQRGRKGKLEERLSKEYNLITSRESGGHGGGRIGVVGGKREQSCVSRLDVTGNRREWIWMHFIPQTAEVRI